ncbi:SIR2 family protein [Hymenobacter sp. M29]|uniref:SIR2 family protein n=1 Tax=Hymenobacter mellowenesis TaxID=3063995 RepID=A0ABT9AJ72_9BACT|nr:SIR2 family protein [Hymenobacter sp. M29]MDO7849910.1 SIR2 family protein [Hymenobacter sp. M29]
MMDKEIVFKEIRKGRALLWAGAGFSRYADYPMGAGVVEALYKELTPTQQKDLAEELGQEKPECPNTMPLPKFAQYFIDLNGGNRNYLIEILDRIFSAQPSRKDVHEQLARIAYFDYIVTTNYDPLFELVYQPHQLHVVRQANQIPQIGNKKVTLFKIHGQPSVPESVIISEDDYNAFWNRADDIVWTYLKGLMSNRTIVFIGYAVEDPNILTILDKIVEKLGKLMKPAYVVGPSISTLRQERLKQNNIYFIKATGEEFVAELWTYIQRTALAELSNDGIEAVVPLGQTLSNLGIDFSVKLDGSKPTIGSLKNQNGPTRSQFKISSASDEVKKALDDLQSGRSLKPVRINIDAMNQFTHTVEGFTLPNDDVVALWIARAPGWEGNVGIRLDNGVLISDVLIKAYRTEEALQLVVLTTASRLELIVRIDKTNKRFNVKAYLDSRHNTYPNIMYLLEHAYIMHTLDRDKIFSVIHQGQTVWSNEHMKMKGRGSSPDDGEQLIAMIEMLPKIEQEFGIIFQNVALDGQIMQDIIDLNYILTHKPVNLTVKESMSFQFDGNNEQIAAIRPGKSALITDEIVMTAEHTRDFHILGWHLRVSWEENDTVVQPICRNMGKGEYKIKSKTKQLVREVINIRSKEVVKAPDWHEPPVLSEADLLEEAQPRH